MRLSNLFLPTLRQAPADAEVVSHMLMLRAGMIRKIATGIYDFLPLGLKVLQKVENIVRQEMNNAGAQEVLLPYVIPAELWQDSGRWQIYGKELLRFKDRADREFCLGPTHEEVITNMASEIRSYKELPKNFYQIQTKFRDEIRPRFGIMRAREFIMKDAYSFHDSYQSLEKEYQNMYQTYCNIFEKCGLKYRVVDADSGNIGGNISQEFMVLADTGEDEIIHCNNCQYSANLEAATSIIQDLSDKQIDNMPIAKIHTPNIKTIEELEVFLKVPAHKILKSLIYTACDKNYLVLVRGDRTINEIKLKNMLQASNIYLADNDTVTKITGSDIGFLGPLNLKQDLTIIADISVKNLQNFICGANETDYHLKNVNLADFKIKDFFDISLAQESDLCPKCQQASLKIEKGIEVGHIFQLGTKYSEAMQANFTDNQGQLKPFIMGCYGIGIGRTVAASIEQNHDQAGILWPKNLAPFQLAIIPIDTKDIEQKDLAEEIYRFCLQNNIEVLIDDRAERAGVKFMDADLIGIPLKVIIGKSIKEGKVEFKDRTSKQSFLVEINDIKSKISNYF